MNKHIIIQSSRDDGSTDDVLSWLYYLNSDVVIDEIFDFYEIENFSMSLTNNNLLSININEISIDKYSHSWYRRGKLSYPMYISKDFENLQQNVYNEVVNPIIDFLDGGFSFRQINKFKDNYVGKLDILYQASQLGLLIPDVLITNNSSELRDFVSIHSKVMTKPIRNPITNVEVEQYILMFSSQNKLITLNDIGDKHYKFMPSFFQKYIDKKYEIRTFYIDGEFKSMAIFSQQNEQTKIDFRNYDLERPNRCVPYQLPNEIETKLDALMQKLNLNCGSFDIIYTNDENYVFLEVNPIGQFQWLSRNCNYFIERLIAKKITND